MSLNDPRDVPLDVLRDFARSQAEATTIRVVAERVGIGRSTLNKFILGRTSPQPRIRRALAVWYFEWVGVAAEIDAVRPYAAALDTLVSELPGVRRDATEARILAELRAGYSAESQPIPRWLNLLVRGHRPS